MLDGSIKKYKKPIFTSSFYPGRDPRIARASQVRGKRQFPVVLFGLLTVGLIAIHGALNASTGLSTGEESNSFLGWILRSEGQPVQIPAPAPVRHAEESAAASPEVSRPHLITSDAKLDAKPFQLASLSVSGSEWDRRQMPAPIQAKKRQALLNNRVVIEKVRSRDSLSSLLQRQNVPLSTVYSLVDASDPVYNLSANLQPEKLVKLVFNSDNKLIALSYPIDRDRTLMVIQKNNGEFSAQVDSSDDDTPVQMASQERMESTESKSRELFYQSAKQVKVKVLRGDYLTGVLSRRQISRVTAVRLAKATKPVYDLARFLKPGNELHLALSETGELVGLSYPLSEERTLWVTRDENQQFVAKIENKVYDIRLETVSGLVQEDGSLFLAGQNAGLTQTMAVRLAALFEWDVDFARDIRVGDRFTVIREAKYYEGRREGDGEIIAAEFINQGNKHQAVRYTDPEGKSGYFDTQGQSMRKMFIRAPVDFSRISSRFAKSRKHPVLGFTRAHKGTDFAASIGTPVRASGKGRVIFAGTRGGFGNLVLVRHNDKYTTAYAHLSRIAKGVRGGTQVSQGQVIGSVGMTGTATGPHLHYEVRIHGKQVDPLSIQLPAADPVPSKYMADFRSKTSSLLASLNNKPINLAALSLPK
ncbi:MAG: peptidoglycan DD-metalloendopeptidase family protein [Magnetococcales bacterium]|nr:peptidoglycan DD-metalloendopeptidase family protein [Magnetococcales bacterium]